MNATPTAAPSSPLVSLKEFFECVPLLEQRAIDAKFEHYNQYGGLRITLPAIQLFCNRSECNRIGRFDAPKDAIEFRFDGDGSCCLERFITYWCRNCRRVRKVYALIIQINQDPAAVRMLKVGESPRFGEPHLNAITDVLDDEIQFFDRGYRAEREGLGIGAFAYYRRFVESHKDKIIAEIRKVAVAHGLSQTILDALDRAAAAREFSAAVAEVKDAIPDSIKINGANPLTLLHNALSAGLHS
jgi:hypothetical protein